MYSIITKAPLFNSLFTSEYYVQLIIFTWHTDKYFTWETRLPRFSWNSEVKASKFTESVRDIFPLCYTLSNACNITVKHLSTHYCGTRREGTGEQK